MSLSLTDRAQFGRKQEFELGIGNRVLYGSLLKNFTEAGVLPVFRTESEDRMVKSALNFAAGFFGVCLLSSKCDQSSLSAALGPRIP